MQSVFRLPWGTDQIAPKMQTGKAALETMRASPVMDISVFNKLKRKRTDSPEPFSPQRVEPAKRQHVEGQGLHILPSESARLPAKPELHRVFTQAPSAAPYSSAHHHSPTNSMGGRRLSRTDSVTADKPDMVSESAAVSSNAAAPPDADVSMADVQVPPAEDVMGFSPLQQVIENEFNMQILTKHNELRLIDQELAKCQIALEQLRRCELRPYPGAQQPAALVFAGTGPSIAPPPGQHWPSDPAPHGVTDGPYTRHYRQWLLHDPQFESTPAQALPPANGGVDAVARSMRGSGSARKSVQKSFTMLSRSGDALNSLPNYPSTSKDKGAPLVLRRSTDGQLVKLICNNCLRGNFSSIQGFLNHCRIAHKVDYKSHDAAAVDCGRLLEEHEAANLLPEALAAVAAVHKPSASRSSSTATTPYKTLNFVHPMNFTNVGGMQASVSQQARGNKVRKPVPVQSLAPTVPPSQRTSSFTPSLQAPRLSAQFAKYQLGGNLEQAIASAKQKIYLGADEDSSSPDALDSASPSAPAFGSRTVLGASRAGSLAPPGVTVRPPSRKGHREPMQRHRPSPLSHASPGAMTVQRREHGEIPESPQDHSPNLSPHTADSNPGLVSDHEDDDHGSASEDEVPQAAIAHSLGVRRGGCTDNMDIDVAVEDDLDQNSVVIRRNSMLAGDERGLRTAGSPSRKLGGSGKGA
ncbi:hypothetical protein LTR85_006775 [Meristemomyces frigidus]|nr:hypothetical protein LTR85_006775 [Meristemomyces frigidus]